MTAPLNFYADFKGLAALRQDAVAQDPKALREAARQFESLFTQMMLKTARQASVQSGMFESDQTDFYRDMFDAQMAAQMSKGKGLGLADMLVRQLQGAAAAPESVRDSRFEIRDSQVETRDAGRETDAPTPTLPRSTGEGTRSSSPVTLSPPLPVPGEGRGEGVLAHHASRVTHHASVPTKLESRISNLDFRSPADFIAQVLPHAEAAGRELGVDPRALVAQAALETGWGKSIPCNADGACSFNLFGIKAGSKWSGPTVVIDTLEFEQGVAVKKREPFRAYDSPEQSFRDYALLLRNNARYAPALDAGNDIAAYADSLQRGGYATDPNYAQKITAIAERLNAYLKTPAAPPLARESVKSAARGET